MLAAKCAESLETPRRHNSRHVSHLMTLLKRPGITTRVFLAVLSTAVLVALFMGVSTHLTFTRGFFGFLNDQQVLRMEAALPRLRQAYAQERSWEFLRDKPDVWFRLLGAEQTLMQSEPPTDAALANSVAPDLLGAGRRLTLLDAQRQRVIGFPTIMATSVQREIVVEGRTVGWLAIAPIQTATDTAVVRFLEVQLHSLWLAVAMAMLLSGLIAWWVARVLLAPVRRVARATHRLAAGDYGTQVEVRGQDEVAQLGQDFNRLSHVLARTEQMRRDFMTDISHELRTPLAVLRGELEAIEDGVHPLTPELLRLLQTEVSTLAQLVQDLHELALADAGALSYRMQDLDLLGLLRQEAQAFEGRLAEQGLSLQLRLDESQPLWVQADAARLRQLLHNLLENSRRYTTAPGVVQLRLARRGDEVWIELQDSAPGVASELLPRLFERFFRVDASRGRAGGGSGLGLAICRSIVQAHGGQIEASPAELGGLRITVRLPLVRGGLA